MSPRVWSVRDRATPADAVYVGRGSPWENPFRIGPDGARAEVVERYLLSRPRLLARLPELAGRDLACHCAPRACHADVLPPPRAIKTGFLIAAAF